MDFHTIGRVARLTARLLSLLYFAFIAYFVAAHAMAPEGLPDLWILSFAQRLDTLALFLVVVGGIVGWKWEGAAAVMVLTGTAIWLLIERTLLWPPGLSLVIAALYAIAWWSARRLADPRVVQQI